MNEVVVATINTEEIAQTEQAEQEKELTAAVSEIEVKAGAIVIVSDADYQNAAAFGRMLKQKSAAVKDFWKPMKDAAHKAHTEICDKEKAMLKPLTNAENILKKTMGAYVAEQERKRREAEEAARKAAREEAERKMQEAIEQEKKGNVAAAAVTAEEAVIMDEAAQTIAVAAEKPKASGVSTKKDWKIVSVDKELVPVYAEGVEIRPVDIAAVLRLIRASKGTVKIPGIQYEETVQMAFRH